MSCLVFKLVLFIDFWEWECVVRNKVLLFVRIREVVKFRKKLGIVVY